MITGGRAGRGLVEYYRVGRSVLGCFNSSDSDTEREDTGQSRHRIDASGSAHRPFVQTADRYEVGSKAGTKKR